MTRPTEKAEKIGRIGARGTEGDALASPARGVYA